ncbi:MAG: DUF4199 domain-containing protein [Flavobacteriales bacterium]|nr:DUF4199 domain-containing protein [Flavobacteriales bacterium]
MNLNSLTLQQGAAAGGLIVLLQLIAYLIGVEVLLGTWLGAGRFILVVVAMVLACVAIRKEEGSLTYGRAVGQAWLAGGLASLIGVLFMVIMGVFDGQLIDHLHEATLVNMEKEMGSFAFAMDDDMKQDVEDQIRWVLEPAGQLFMWAIGMLFWLLVAAIVGAIYKRPNPTTIH